MTRGVGIILLVALGWAVIGLLHAAGSKAGLWPSLPYPARYYGENPTE